MARAHVAGRARSPAAARLVSCAALQARQASRAPAAVSRRAQAPKAAVGGRLLVDRAAAAVVDSGVSHSGDVPVATRRGHAARSGRSSPSASGAASIAASAPECVVTGRGASRRRRGRIKPAVCPSSAPAVNTASSSRPCGGSGVLDASGRGRDACLDTVPGQSLCVSVSTLSRGPQAAGTKARMRRGSDPRDSDRGLEQGYTDKRLGKGTRIRLLAQGLG